MTRIRSVRLLLSYSLSVFQFRILGGRSLIFAISIESLSIICHEFQFVRVLMLFLTFLRTQEGSDCRRYARRVANHPRPRPQTVQSTYRFRSGSASIHPKWHAQGVGADAYLPLVTLSIYFILNESKFNFHGFRQIDQFYLSHKCRAVRRLAQADAAVVGRQPHVGQGPQAAFEKGRRQGNGQGAVLQDAAA